MPGDETITTKHQLMMSQLAAPQSNAKRYWGEEKNIDSVYSIYIKKIFYTHINDVSLCATNTIGDEKSSSRRNPQDEKHRKIDSSNVVNSISNNDVSRFAIQEQQIDGCQRKETPRSRRNFFQKYRRRSCSVDKYSLERAHKDVEITMTGTPASKSSKVSRYGLSSSSSKKKLNGLQMLTKEDAQLNLADFDGFATTKSSNDFVDSGRKPSKDIDRSYSNSSNRSSAKVNVSTHKSMSDISMQTQAQSLLWETRKIKILQAATLDHILKFILLINNNPDKEHPSNNISPQQTPSTDVTSNANSTSSSSAVADNDDALDEERNNVAHVIHVFFCTYRIYTNPYELMLKLMDYSDICRIEQYRFVMYYWLDNYPEDFDYMVEHPENSSELEAGNHHREPSTTSFGNASVTQSTNSYTNSVASCDSSANGRTSATTDSEINATLATTTNGVEGLAANATTVANNNTASINSRISSSINHAEHYELSRDLSNLSLKTNNSLSNSNRDGEKKLGVPLVNELLRLCQDEQTRKRALKLNDLRHGPRSTSGSIDSTGSETVGRSKASSRYNQYRRVVSSKNSAVLDLDSRYVAQQLTAIDLENFLNLRPYALLEGSKSDKRIRSMIKNFNLLSRHVVVTILKSHNPNIVAAHWIAIAMNLRKIKNFNSLKAIIAGLTNEAVYRLRMLVWNRLDRISVANFNLMASIVDDVNNQTVLRQTQLVVEGTAKMSIEDDSFGTIPYLGTFLTDLNMIDARHPNYVPSPKDETSKLKLINFEKCAKQFEILTQLQLLQKNVLASLHAIQRRKNFDELNRSQFEQYHPNYQLQTVQPVLPKVSRLFENWFFDDEVAAMTDKQWYVSYSLSETTLFN